ncbi:MAG: tRNA threonylcarbamoyladenosine biosynthesis protein TsaB [uncultured Sphingomonadaceae bacterium]|uniref:tRNA threonylcarbamoyladenosine biosynthesis protein TsaB n=1 Tax=uncultured Sphingomonadaceae bacterium TaxID=169976 RepID=A0A6J4SN54_9SPHN|nr:MAG: tRNA threonylcarbamoyladenosine biosynthesis protein TsaB [uncultured Sphingomonadaceae bacterium]
MLLVISSATEAVSLALLDLSDAVLAERHELIGRGHAERLVQMIAEMLRASGERPTAILADCGPGSFTGIRVGLAAANGLSIGWGVPVSGVSALALLAAGAPAGRDAAEVAVAMVGGHGELFVQSFARMPFRALDEPRSLPPEMAVALPQPLVVGNAAEQLVAARGFGEALPAHPRAADARLLPPAFRALPVRPLYVRAPDAKPGRVA